MAERRMFSKRIVESGRFLRMPVSTQCLYFHLGLQADDDGVAEAYNAMNSIGATEDDLKILVAKGFVIVLNEDLVSYITDWRENNKIRADRKVDSIYKKLLLRVVPDANLLQEKQRADRKIPDQKECNGIIMGRPNDNQLSTTGQHRIGKDRLDKDRIDNLSFYLSENAPKNLSTVSTIPTLKEVESFCEEISGSVDVKRFYDYYTKNNWTTKNGDPITNWKKTFLDWERREGNFESKSKKSNKSEVPESPMADAYRGLVFNLKE